MTHIEGRHDKDLHDENGEHIGTARTANGRDLERHERRIKAHLAEHAELAAAAQEPDSEDPSVSDRVNEWGITIKAEGGQLVKDSDWARHEWAVELTGPHGTMSIPYNKGVGHDGEPPTAAEVLSDMRSEASTFYNGESFEDYCGNFGLNTDSRAEEKRYRAIVASGEQLKAILGDDRFELLMTKTEEM